MYKTWTINIRPTQGITDEQIAALTRFGHRSDYHLHGVEKESTERHSHMGVYLPRFSTKSNICNRLLAMPAFRMLDENERRRLRAGVKIMYNTDFVMGYIGDEAKKDAYTEASRNLPDDLDILDTYYPDKDDTQAKKPLSIWYNTMEKHWRVENPVRNPRDLDTLQNFLYRLMYRDRVIEVISDPRIFKNKLQSLYYYIKKFAGRVQQGPNGLPEM